MVKITRKHYAELYGPTTGDAVRLGDTELIAEIESKLEEGNATRAQSLSEKLTKLVES